MHRLAALAKLGSPDAIRLAWNGWWHDPEWTAKEIALVQLRQTKIIMDIDALHDALEEALERPVWTHEMADPVSLLAELESQRPPKSEKEIHDQLLDMTGDTPVVPAQAPVVKPPKGAQP